MLTILIRVILYAQPCYYQWSLIFISNILSLTCSDGEQNSCLTCDNNAFRTQFGSSCICETGYFDVIN